MGIKITNSTIEFALRHDPLDLLDLKLQSVSEICNFFTNSGWSCALTVSTAHHGDISILLCKALKLGEDPLQRYMHHILARVMQHQRICQVVDVLTCAGKVNEFLVPCELWVLIEFLFQEIFHCLHIMIRGRLYGLDALGILQRELVEYLVEEILLLEYKLNVFLALGSDLLLEEALEPLDLDEDSVAH